MSGFNIVTLVSGNQFSVRQPLAIQTDIHGFLYIIEIINGDKFNVEFVTRETYNPHAWVSYKWQEDEEKK